MDGTGVTDILVNFLPGINSGACVTLAWIENSLPRFFCSFLSYWSTLVIFAVNGTDFIHHRFPAQCAYLFCSALWFSD